MIVKKYFIKALADYIDLTSEFKNSQFESRKKILWCKMFKNLYDDIKLNMKNFRHTKF